MECIIDDERRRFYMDDLSMIVVEFFVTHRSTSYNDFDVVRGHTSTGTACCRSFFLLKEIFFPDGVEIGTEPTDHPPALLIRC